MLSDPIPIGDRLRTLREARDLTRYRLAQLSGVAESLIVRIEAGTDPRWSTVCRLAAGLGVGVGELAKETRR
jgi:transcriptional regulator with XRE-family HTH domain